MCSIFGRYSSLLRPRSSSASATTTIPTTNLSPTIPKNTILYVVGGLYGNVFALDALQQHIQKYETGNNYHIYFNGDFNFFNTCTQSWNEINERVLNMKQATCTAGNIERAVCENSTFQSCGCDYPSYVDPQVSKYANEITKQLHQIAWSTDNGEKSSWIRKRLLELPPFQLIHIDHQNHHTDRIAILHGDLNSVSGWDFAVEVMEPLDERIRKIVNHNNNNNQLPITNRQELQDDLSALGVNIIACSHTCVPFAQYITAKSVIFNNGAAGIPNFANMPGIGLVTRIDTSSSSSRNVMIPHGSLYGTTIGNCRIDGIAIPYDQDKFVKFFLSRHPPPSSPAYLSYYKRITKGLSWWSVDDVRERLERSSVSY
jgi:hypothetical protein